MSETIHENLVNSDLSKSNSESASENQPNRMMPVLEIIAVFSPILLLIVVYKALGITNPMIVIGATCGAYIAMLLVIAAILKRRREGWETIGLGFESPEKGNLMRTVIKSIGIFVFAVASFVAGSIVMANIVGIPEPADLSRYNYLSGNLPILLLSLAGVYVVSSFGEEVIYRGFLITRFKELFGENSESRFALITALLLSSLIFGFAHFEWGAMGIVQTAFMGAALGLSFILNGYRLWPLVLAHCYLDTILLVPLYFAPQ